MTTGEADKWDKHFHTHVRPLDKNGVAIKPLDLVVIDDIPDWYCNDPETPGLKDYAGQYGLITYFTEEPWYGGLRGYPGWVSPNGESLHVVSRRICDDWVSEFDFSLPPSSVRKIPYNVIISAIFADYPCQMPDDDGPGTHPFIIRGMEQFAFIERVLKTPYEELEKAHAAAVRFLAPEA